MGNESNLTHFIAICVQLLGVYNIWTVVSVVLYSIVISEIIQNSLTVELMMLIQYNLKT